MARPSASDTVASQSWVVRPPWTSLASQAIVAPGCARAEEVRLELDGREADRAVGQVEDAAVAARRVGESDHGAGVQVAVRRHVLVLEREPCAGESVADLVELDPEQPGKPRGAHLLQLRERELHAAEPTLAPPWPDQAERS